MCPEAYQALQQEILEAAHDRFRFPELKKKEGKAAADGKVETAVVEQSASKGRPVNKATASTRKQKGKKDKEEEKKTRGQRKSTAAGKRRSTARSPSDADRSSGAAEALSHPSRTVVNTDQPPAAGKSTAKSKRKRRSSIA
ncbi:unnamed protein product [Ectocarpus sp. 12 AP-2014]